MPSVVRTNIFLRKFIGLRCQEETPNESTGLRNTSEQQFRVEFECEFLGSVDTLISPSKLRVMAYEDPIESKNGLDVFKEPEKDHNYTMTVDVARGIDGDYSAFTLFDTTTVPYQLVVKYRNNTVKPMLFPDIICQVS